MKTPLGPVVLPVGIDTVRFVRLPGVLHGLRDLLKALLHVLEVAEHPPNIGEVRKRVSGEVQPLPRHALVRLDSLLIQPERQTVRGDGHLGKQLQPLGVHLHDDGEAIVLPLGIEPGQEGLPRRVVRRPRGYAGVSAPLEGAERPEPVGEQVDDEGPPLVPHARLVRREEHSAPPDAHGHHRVPRPSVENIPHAFKNLVGGQMLPLLEYPRCGEYAGHEHEEKEHEGDYRLGFGITLREERDARQDAEPPDDGRYGHPADLLGALPLGQARVDALPRVEEEGVSEAVRGVHGETGPVGRVHLGEG
mmetsp:Transcript_17478/g.50976  ORF Transcript_17478/g.50976 Transcript_17478/m.50976 type:complete len:305 (+) Transcript_17478:1074-1988(+)